MLRFPKIGGGVEAASPSPMTHAKSRRGFSVLLAARARAVAANAKDLCGVDGKLCRLGGETRDHRMGQCAIAGFDAFPRARANQAFQRCGRSHRWWAQNYRTTQLGDALPANRRPARLLPLLRNRKTSPG